VESRPVSKILRVLPALAVVLGLAGAAHAAVPTMPFDEVQPGMTGTGRTVFAGTEISTFEVEILGKLPNVGPDQNLILARCSGGPLAETGVLSGMSGSPVVIDGRLIGAVAYSWGFSTEAIAGITPIDEMLAISRLPAPEPGARLGGLEIDRARLVAMTSADSLRAFLEDDLWPVLERSPGSLALPLPISIAGIGSAGLARIAPGLERAGFTPVQSGSYGRSAAEPPPVEPGSPIGVKLVRGDLEMTATGTVTWVDDDRILAFGHPLFGLGPIDLPLTGASVETLLPSLMQSSRIAVPLAEIGALRQDRASGIFGLAGARPRMIPVRFNLSHPTRGDNNYAFDIADDPMLSPLLLYVSINGILASRERAFGNATVRIRQGSVIKMESGEDVALDNLFSGPAAFDYGTGIPAYILYLLMNNAWTRPNIAGVNLMLEYDEQPRTARIRRASLDRYHVRAGETVETAIVLAPFRGREQVFTRSIRIPDETPAGKLTLQVGGALAVSQAEDNREPVLPRDLNQLVRLINQLRRNDQIYIAATRADSGVLLGGSRMPNLPPSVANVLSRPSSRGNFVHVPWRSILEESVETAYAVEGSAEITLEVESP
jgi:hypothetical protein